MKGGKPMVLFLVVNIVIVVALGFIARMLWQKK